MRKKGGKVRPLEHEFPGLIGGLSLEVEENEHFTSKIFGGGPVGRGCGFAVERACSWAAAVAVDRQGDPLSRLTWNSFYPYVTSTFTFSDKKGNRVDLQLMEMTDMKPADFVTSSSGQECFALTFTGPSRRRLPQDTYAVEHFALGGFALFITTGEASRKSVKYFAIINRLFS